MSVLAWPEAGLARVEPRAWVTWELDREVLSALCAARWAHIRARHPTLREARYLPDTPLAVRIARPLDSVRLSVRRRVSAAQIARRLDNTLPLGHAAVLAARIRPSPALADSEAAAWDALGAALAAAVSMEQAEAFTGVQRAVVSMVEAAASTAVAVDSAAAVMQAVAGSAAVEAVTLAAVVVEAAVTPAINPMLLCNPRLLCVA